ncbi:MAG: DNA helicase RecQ [Flavobacteriales bacterium]
MLVEETTIKEALQKYFGFDTFKGQQEAIIKNVLDGNHSFVIMPTGGGKSLCYQLPALMMEGTAIVVSPLIALMKNQVDAIRNTYGEDSVAHFLNSSLNKSEITQVKKDVEEGRTKLLYVAPESLNKQENLDFLLDNKISFFAIDEAHCISEWGHDFRPEYRKLRPMIDSIGDHIPIIALTATATPKVQQDIQKNLSMSDATAFKSSFNRANLFYEVRPKLSVEKEIIKFVKRYQGKSGIIYCLSRKKVEEIAELLQVNGINALPYHAGLDANSRAKHQDMFLMEEADVIVATIAFGMGIDKPDVRFVIHHDIPKSLESYYQETGRAGRDGGEGICVAFYSYKDIEKLEKFLYGKPVSEQEIGRQLLNEMVGYAETSVCRRKFVLHYFGEEYDETTCSNMCDNCATPRERYEGKDIIHLLLSTIGELKEKHKAKYLVNLLTGKYTNDILTYKHDKINQFGAGSEHSEAVWNAAIRQSVIQNLLYKEVENYGILRLTDAGRAFIKQPESFIMLKEHDYSKMEEDDVILNTKAGSGASDEALFTMLKELRKKISKEKNVPPFVIFQDPSLEEMATQYPITQEELTKISGVGQGKAARYGQPFISLIQTYVEENEIDRPEDFVMKSVVNKSGLKVHIIMNVDRKMPLDAIARAKGINMPELLDEMESIVNSGTKLNIDYYVNEVIEDECQEEIFDYFSEAETDSIDEAINEFGDIYSEEELRMMRIKFYSELGN